MALYYYKGVQGGGKKVSGYVPAHTDKEAERNVERLAIRNYKIKKEYLYVQRKIQKMRYSHD